jgi:diaminopimelate epimerase
MKILFVKMQGLGNDFVVLDATKKAIPLTKPQIQQMADRKFGIGFDQLLMLEACPDASADFYYRIFNADGSEVEQCGNGARCVGRFIKDKGLSQKKNLTLKTKKGYLNLSLESNNWVSVQMGIPLFEPSDIPFLTDQSGPVYSLALANDEIMQFGVVNIGNPHAIIQVNALNSKQVQETGAFLERHKAFPQGVNVSFMQIIDRNQIHLQVFERGVGPTLACGSAACASMAWGKKMNWLDNDVKVLQPGGSLEIYWKNQADDIKMSGPAEFVFHGEYCVFSGLV